MFTVLGRRTCRSHTIPRGPKSPPRAVVYSTITAHEDVPVKMPRKWWQRYTSLTKETLSAGVLATTVVGYIIAPAPIIPSTLFWTTVGTGLVIASASAFNQILEVDRDALMPRTANRVLPSGEMPRDHANNFAYITGVAGALTLFAFTNTLTTLLAVGTLGLYVGVYTSMKKTNVLNTWVGAAVGAVPPLIGWAAATGGLSGNALLLASTMVLWQIPHFGALSWIYSEEYRKAGFEMLVNRDPEGLLKQMAICTGLLFTVPFLAVYFDLTYLTFAPAATVLNLLLGYTVREFYNERTVETANEVYKASKRYLALLMALFCVYGYDSL